VRFGELRGLTSLPINRVRDQFRYEEVLTVLPVQDVATSRETLLVATRPMLALLTPLRVPSGHWATRWAPWETVQLPTPPTSRVPDELRLLVLVGRQSFEARLWGEAGRRAARDFVAAVRMARPTVPGTGPR
jgi:hypothetical protein